MTIPPESKIPMITMVVNWIAILSFGWVVFGELSDFKSQINLIDYRLQQLEQEQQKK